MKLLLLLLCLFASVGFSFGAWLQESVEHVGDAICFDLDGDGRDHNTETNCRIYVQNDRKTESQHGVRDAPSNDCIPMYAPSASEYTYLWTTCSDAMWIDEMQVLVGDCNWYGRRNLFGSVVMGVARFGARIYSNGRITTSRRGCQNYGSDNSQGWCLSTDRNDYHGGWYHRVPAKRCFKMLRLGKPANYDSRVWSLSQGYQDSIMRDAAGRRHLEALIQDKIASVRECEKQNKEDNKDCNDLANEVFALMRPVDESPAWEEVTTSHKVSAKEKKEVKVAKAETFFHKFDKDEDHKLSLEEFEDLFAEVVEENQEEAQKLFRKLDQDASGQLDIHEICEVLFEAAVKAN